MDFDHSKRAEKSIESAQTKLFNEAYPDSVGAGIYTRQLSDALEPRMWAHKCSPLRFGSTQCKLIPRSC